MGTEFHSESRGASAAIEQREPSQCWSARAVDIESRSQTPLVDARRHELRQQDQPYARVRWGSTSQPTRSREGIEPSASSLRLTHREALASNRVGLDGNVSHGIHLGVIQIQQTETYAKWFAGLRDRVARARIDIRIRRLSLGNAGDAKPVGEGVSELRVDHGPGYRVYFIQRGEVVIVLLAGGDKSTQDKDIRNAKALANDLKEF